MSNSRVQTLRPVLVACGVFLLAAALLLPLVAVAQSTPDGSVYSATKCEIDCAGSREAGLEGR
jgi:hypothetical protein